MIGQSSCQLCTQTRDLLRAFGALTHAPVSLSTRILIGLQVETRTSNGQHLDKTKVTDA
eukprot:m.872415 g.872415  ORF g.872415 m.872415 type:complete len:59 (-) comp59775_c1_seq18:2107-2283(-)